ncbi:MAG: ImmA/IrrE family metallo-endopeptidase [Brevibacterium aurantiacum]|nr:ImmA/IrrE family metallo-endopeptidase [Brevibacterium aurantiacum]
MKGEVIETLMRARGLTQADLALAIGAAQATVSRYISGARTPEDSEIRRIAGELGVTPAFLAKEFRMRAAIGVSAHMRRQSSTKVSMWKSAEAKLNELRMHMSMLTERAPLQTATHVPTFDYQFTKPAEAARRVRTAWRVPLGPVRSVVDLMETAGTIVCELDLGTHRIDGLSQWVSDYPLVIVNSWSSPSRKRLTLAHELGHLVMHADGYVDDEMIDVEAQANEFAAEFLMPEAEIRHQLKTLKLPNLLALKLEWGVSMQAIFERAFRLGLASGTDRQNFYRQISRKGWRTEEPEEDRVPVESPRLVSGLVAQFRSAGLTNDDFADLTGYARDAVPDVFLPQSGRHLSSV